MLIGFSADENHPDSNIAKRFGQAEYIQIFDTETGSYSAVKNIKEHSHKNLDQIVKSGVTVFVVGNIGPNSFYTINDLGGSVFLARNKSVNEAARAFWAGELKKLTEPTVKKSIAHSDPNHQHDHDEKHQHDHHHHHENHQHEPHNGKSRQN